MIIRNNNSIDIIQGNNGYGNAEGITDWRLENRNTGVFNILNSSLTTSRLTIIENGNVGIGTVPITSSSKLEIIGDINISGNYRKNNIDFISDTSNYVLSTSNILVNRVSNNNSQWINVSSGIYYPLSNPITSSPAATTRITGNYTYMQFTYTTDNVSGLVGQTQYTITVPAGVMCDILIVGGGGAGGDSMGGGGGAGGVVYAINQILPASTYKINVGRGGIGGSTAEEQGTAAIDQDGKESSLMNSDGTSYISLTLGGVSQQLRGLGGGGGGVYYDPAFVNGRNGGSGGGCTETNNNGWVINTAGSATQPATYWNGSAYVVGGKAGRQNTTTAQDYGAGGGGGLGDISSDYRNGNDGVAISITGTSKFYAAGGGAGQYIGSSTTAGLGGSSIGGNGRIWTGSAYAAAPRDVATSGVDGTGSGGGGNAYSQAPVSIAGSGGSGVVIIRYLTSTKNVGIGTTYPETKLHLYDDTINETKLTIQNNYVEPIIITPNTIGYTAVETLESNKYYRTLTFNYFPNYPENSPNTSLLAWYRFDSDGLDYNPYPTKYNLIANVGTPTYSTGTTADSFFQGRRYINTSSGSLKTTALALASRSFSVSVWMRTKNSASFSSLGPFTSLINQGNALANTSIYLGYFANNAYGIAFINNDLSCGTGVSGNPTSYSGDLNNWVHIVYVVLSNFNRRIYRNGILIATDANTTASTATGDIRFGADYNNNNVSINTDISDVRIYDNGLSAYEVSTLYNSYTNLVITDNYSLNFKNATTLLVNSVSKTVNGAYTLSMGHINSSMLPAGGQSDIPLASTAITSVPIKYEYSSTTLSLPALITVAGATSSIIGTTERCISFPYTTDSSGLTGQTQYTFTPTEDLWCDILIVGGGGGGGKWGGGGGAGHVLFGTNISMNANLSVSVKVGNGGTGSTNNINGLNGYNSSIIINSIIYIANGGGGGGSRGTNNGIGSIGNNGGSGGGGSPSYYQTYQGFGGICDNNKYSNFQSFGNNGGKGTPDQNSSEPALSSGGGGGAGSIGSDFSYITGGGNGGKGKDFISYFGTNVGHNGYFGGGGGGQTWYNAGNRGYGNGGLGLYGGGGNGGFDGTLEYSADNGLANTGGGGGGGKGDGTTSGSVNGGNGGSGFIIIRYRKIISQSSSIELISNTLIQKLEGLPDEIIVPGATSMAISGTLDRYILFTNTTTYTFTPTETLNCDILVIGGGGAGGGNGGGGGGGSGYVYFTNITLTPKSYTISVGAGGAGGYGSYTNGGNSSFIANDNSISYTSLGGGAGGTRPGPITNSAGSNGGCGGGGASAGNGEIPGLSRQNSTYGYGTGFNGGYGYNNNSDGYGSAGGGGGGAGSAGTNSGNYNGGIGGDGISNNITGTPIIYCAGGGGAPSSYTGNTGKSGSNNQGSYGSGSYGGQEGQGGPTGKNGVVIIRYRKTQTTTRTINTNNYKIGNYNGDFIIKSSLDNIDTNYISIIGTTGAITNPTGTTTWTTASDRRIKENIERASYDKCYESINKLELNRFNYINGFNTVNRDITQLGFIAQEVKEIFPKSVFENSYINNNINISDLQSIDTTQINYTLYGAVKKLIEIINDNKKNIKKIENTLNIDIDTISTSNYVLIN